MTDPSNSARIYDLQVKGYKQYHKSLLPRSILLFSVILQIKNTSSLSVDYTIKFDSLSPLRYKNMQELPSFVRPDGSKPHVIGAQNYNGKCVFDCTPYAGTIPGGKISRLRFEFPKVW